MSWKEKPKFLTEFGLLNDRAASVAAVLAVQIGLERPVISRAISLA
jgi:hypothetical protein